MSKAPSSVIAPSASPLPQQALATETLKHLKGPAFDVWNGSQDVLEFVKEAREMLESLTIKAIPGLVVVSSDGVVLNLKLNGRNSYFTQGVFISSSTTGTSTSHAFTASSGNGIQNLEWHQCDVTADMTSAQVEEVVSALNAKFSTTPLSFRSPPPLYGGAPFVVITIRTACFLLSHGGNLRQFDVEQEKEVALLLNSNGQITGADFTKTLDFLETLDRDLHNADKTGPTNVEFETVASEKKDILTGAWHPEPEPISILDPFGNVVGVDAQGKFAATQAQYRDRGIVSLEQQAGRATRPDQWKFFSDQKSITYRISEKFTTFPNLDVRSEGGELLRLTYNGRTSYLSPQGVYISTRNQNYIFLALSSEGIPTWFCVQEPTPIGAAAQVEDVVRQLNTTFQGTQLFFFSPPLSFGNTALIVVTITNATHTGPTTSFLLAHSGDLRLLNANEQEALVSNETSRAHGLAASGLIASMQLQTTINALKTLAPALNDPPPSSPPAWVTKARAMLSSVSCCRRRSASSLILVVA